MYLLVVFLPLLNFLVSGLFGRFFGKKGVGLLLIINMLITVLLSIIIFYEIGILNSNCLIYLFHWINVGILNIKWIFFFDSLTVIMLVVVNLISFVVHLYSYDYMYEDPHIIRFLSYLSFFTFFMLILVTSENYLQLFLGWEGVGLASYLLINFWYTRIAANKAALKAIILNRVGDLSLCFSILFLFLTFKSLDFGVIFPLVIDYIFIKYNFFFSTWFILNIISFFFFIGVIGKSAQIGLHPWLPDAMEGPTPVSALIHAATMVTAGVFLLIRTSPLLEFTQNFLPVVAFIGLLTSFFAGTMGLFTYDLKKIIAYSTCSQLGYMVLACGTSNYVISLFHLMNHAFFKALLFLGAGVIIHLLADEQDIRKMGGLVNLIPFIYVCMLFASLALMGFPFLSGFYSKDLLLEFVNNYFLIKVNFVYFVGISSAFLTAFYSFRLIYLVFLGKPRGSYTIYSKIHDISWFMFISLFLLFLGTLFSGYLFSDIFIGIGSDFFSNSIPLSVSVYYFMFLEEANILIKFLPFFFSFLGMFLAFFCLKNEYFLRSLKNWVKVKIYFNEKWLFDYNYNQKFSYPFLNLSYEKFFLFLDKGFIDFYGPKGLTFLFHKVMLWNKKFQNGYFFLYSFLIVFILFSFIAYFYFFIFLNFQIFWYFVFFCIFFDIIFFI